MTGKAVMGLSTGLEDSEKGHGVEVGAEPVRRGVSPCLREERRRDVLRTRRRSVAGAPDRSRGPRR